MKNIRRLNDDGITIFSQTNWGNGAGADGDPPSHLLFDPDYSEVIEFSNGNPREIDTEATFETGFELVDLLELSFGNKLEPDEVSYDRGMWAWLALLFYPQIRKKKDDGTWKNAAAPRFIPSTKSTSYYRHSLAARYNMWQGHGANASYMLHGPVDTWREAYEQYTNVSIMISSKSIQETANKLAYDDTKKSGIKKGIGAKTGGSARRFPAVFWQLYETYDLRSMTSDQILELLPAEFDEFNPLAQEEE